VPHHPTRPQFQLWLFVTPCVEVFPPSRHCAILSEKCSDALRGILKKLVRPSPQQRGQTHSGHRGQTGSSATTRECMGPLHTTVDSCNHPTLCHPCHSPAAVQRRIFHTKVFKPLDSNRIPQRFLYYFTIGWCCRFVQSRVFLPFVSPLCASYASCFSRYRSFSTWSSILPHCSLSPLRSFHLLHPIFIFQPLSAFFF